MKPLYSLFLTFGLVVLIPACEKEIRQEEQFHAFVPANIDPSAGNWATVHLTAPNQIAVPPPAPVNSDSYQAELEAIKDAQQKLTAQQHEIIRFWSGTGVLRWNQIMRELVAQFNLPPAPLPDGTYPVPDPENPFSDPRFPFANPPYAARAYSYVSTAMYDALIATWHYKFLYNRPAPYEVDDGIKAFVPQTDLPSYPSEEAVMSGVATELLKALFPAAVEKITRWAADQRNAALWSGKATPSDISAGLALGKAVAAIFMIRARADGMSAAAGNKAQWEALKLNATSRGDVAWVSLDIPPRPPMLPFFGNVLPWKMTHDDIVALRPPPPPLADSEEMKAELNEVKQFLKNSTRERLRIVHFWADGAGTYTPPGHWNDIAAEYIAEAQFSEVRSARAFALLNMALHNAAVACWETKYFYFNPRPSQLDPSVKTLTGIPNFPSYTSGHSTFSGAAATILSYLFPAHQSKFNDMAKEASMSRLYGGIHYRKDCEVGLDHGKQIGNFLLDNFARTDGAD
ncbi:MAG: phosphatase PAP2 family protein [Cyclobacteriaceae bacterium]|nr:phosphatase PAP2 family protein [Cyclobacteriaceae bacterium]MDW8332029.1 phosphatase PAP2 family protein [Cyclobacteriaceae bacterium]